ncbi:MAG: recombinase family protein [Vagococcus sp.]|jgi:DNA invertase Pin-like site-specific DNA recombinase|nr:recombinase family protein [Vagococcus sp.]
MERVGYINLDVLNDEAAGKEMKALRELKVERFIHDENELYQLKINTELIIYELKSLGKAILQLEQILPNLEEKNIRLTIAKKNSVLNGLSGDCLFKLLLEIADSERHIIRERTIKGITEARRKGRVGGRPGVSKETIERIKYLYHNQSYSLRDIALECGVSLGTAYKYVQS